MSKTRKIAFGGPVIAVFFAAGIIGSTHTQLIARESGQSVPTQAILTDGDTETTELLLLLDTDKSGRVSKQEFMRFMEAEFNRLDKDKSGELDVRELTQSQLKVKSHIFTVAGK